MLRLGEDQLEQMIVRLRHTAVDRRAAIPAENVLLHEPHRLAALQAHRGLVAAPIGLRLLLGCADGIGISPTG